MGVMVVCGLAVVAALVLAVRWRRDEFHASWSADGAPAKDRLRSLARTLTVGSLSGLVTGLLFIGPAGRLAMRLLAATSPEVRGQSTEAAEVIGRITVGGTVGFVVFVGLPFGFAVGLIYPFVARVFPRGLVGGATYGAVLLVLFSWFVDPLRSSNPDFTLLEPGWLAVLTFSVMAVLTGVVLVPVTGRIDAALGEPTLRWLWWMVPVGILAVPSLVFGWPALIIVAAGSVAWVFLPTTGDSTGFRRWALPAATGIAVVAALPAFLSSVFDIA